MNFEGGLVIDRPPEEVWNFFWDVARLSRCIPGCERVETLKEREKYQLTISDSVGPIRVNFEACADVSVVEAGKGIRVMLQGKDLKGGGLRQTMEITLEEVAKSRTKVNFKASVTVFGKLGTLGYPFIKKKVNSVIEEFGQRVKSEIEAA